MSVKNLIKYLVIFVSFQLLLSSCNPIATAKKIYKPVDLRTSPLDPDERAKKNIEEGRGISLKNLGNRKTTYEFSTSNPMWRASLEILDFLPLTTVDYSGGVIITDWYSDENSNGKDAIKISLRFLGNEIRSESLKVIVHKKTCLSNQNCKVVLLDKTKIREEVHASILRKAALLDKENKNKKEKISLKWKEQIFKQLKKNGKKFFSSSNLYNKNGKKFYCLEMFPYPSGKIHMGHVRNYTIGDVIARHKFLNGYNVLHPMGWDAFGLPAENAARLNNLSPKKWTEQNIKTMKNQLKMLGLSIDWDLEISTCDKDYYKHQQELFIDFYNKGLVSRKETYVNWDPIENTVLANEQVINGRGWRSNAVVQRKKLSQWFFNITKFSDVLLEELENLKGWPEKVKLMQKNWIGKSLGCEIKFEIINSKEKLKVFTTRPDTIFGASFIAISVDHPLCETLEKNNDFQNFKNDCSKIGTTEEALANAEKLGFKTNFSVKHPFIKNKTLPVYVANFVLMDYGDGAIFGCPAHDQRDFDFAKKYKLAIIRVVSDTNSSNKEDLSAAYTGTGKMINSEFLNDLNIEKAKEVIIQKN